MKAKRIALLVSIITLILVFVILSSTVFSLNRVEFSFLRPPVHYKSLSTNSFINDGEFQMGQSVFFVDKQSHINKIEKQYPYLKILGIETIFPNILLIQSIEREDYFAVSNLDKSRLAIIDGDFKILRVIDYTSTPNLPMIDNSLVAFNHQNEGDFLPLSSDCEILTNLPNYFVRIGYNSHQVASFLKQIRLSDNVLKLYSYNNYRIEIAEPTKFLLEKLALAYQTIYGDNGVSEDFCGLIKVFQNGSELLANAIQNG